MHFAVSLTWKSSVLWKNKSNLMGYVLLVKCIHGSFSNIFDMIRITGLCGEAPIQLGLLQRAYLNHCTEESSF
jgi:hypothetical protein